MINVLIRMKRNREAAEKVTFLSSKAKDFSCIGNTRFFTAFGMRDSLK